MLSSAVALAITVLLQVTPQEAERQRQIAKAAMFASPRISPVASPERLEVLPVQDLLSRLKPGESASQLGLAAHFRVIQEPRPRDERSEQALRRLLLDPGSYGAGVSGCAFSPFLTLRGWSGKTFVDVLVGDGCYQVAFAENGRDLLGYFVLTDRAAARLKVLVAQWRSRDGAGEQ